MSPDRPIKLYLDEHVWFGLSAALRERGHDALHVYEADRGGLDDEGQLTFAASNGRAILTFNARDFEPLAAEWFLAGRSHAGIIVSNQISIGELLYRIERLLGALSADEMRGTVRYLQMYR